MKTRALYGWIAIGRDVCDWRFQAYSKNLFLDEKSLEADRERFIESCCDSSKLKAADRDTLELHVGEYVLNES